jgi:hypothetical protein
LAAFPGGYVAGEPFDATAPECSKRGDRDFDVLFPTARDEHIDAFAQQRLCARATQAAA